MSAPLKSRGSLGVHRAAKCKEKGYGKCRKVTHQASSPDPPSAVAKPKPVKAKKISIGDLGNVPRTKADPPGTQMTRGDKSLPSKLNDEEEDGNEFNDGSTDLEPDKPQVVYRCPNKLTRTYAMRDVSASLDSDEDQEEDHTNGNDSDADHQESEGKPEDPESTAMMLLDEVPLLVGNIKVNSQKAMQVKSHGKNQSTRDAKQAAEIPTWRNFDNSASDETTTVCGESSEPYSSDVEGTPKVGSAQTITSLIRTEKGHIKLLDQNNETQQVVKDAIVDAKGYIIFVNAYPELVDKNQVALQSLLTYMAHLASLVEPRIPLLHRDLKAAACTNIDSYFHLSNNMVKAKKLMEQHAYIYALRFDSNDDASPIGKKPYQGDLLIFLIYEGVFSGAKSIGVKFANHFAELADNKGNRPECPIPLLALVATAVYAALFWKTLGSPGKFNFTGNQFSETYVFHVKFLEDLKRDAPGKFHCMMADIYEAVQALKWKGNDHFANEHRDALGLLDLDGMADD
ncbi:hypothetical protein BDR05DRAFT_944331 [Suillus weaverae]|nr:hypothetical protein BDR05DRAFT_944331 [Suillus weaverae]